MTASETGGWKVKRSEKIGGLRKDAGPLSFAGLAKPLAAFGLCGKY
jgi:hypothetical protein